MIDVQTSAEATNTAAALPKEGGRFLVERITMSRISRSDVLTLAACLGCPALILGLSLVFPIWVLPWTAAFAIPRGSVMLIYALAGLLTTLLMPVVGRLLVRFPAWSLMAAGGVVLGGGFLLLGVVTTYWQLAIVYSIAVAVGGVLGGILPAQSIAVRRFPQWVGIIGGLIMIGISAGGIAAPLLLAPLLAAAGWRVSVMAAGAFILGGVPLLAWAFLRNEASNGGVAPEHAGRSTGGPHKAGARALSTKQILSKGAFWLIVIGILPLATITSAVQGNLMPFLADHGVPAHQGSSLLAVFFGGNALGALAVGWLADRVDPRAVLGGVAAMMAVALVALTSGKNFLFMEGAMMTLGVGAGGLLPLIAIFIFRGFGADGFAPAAGLFSLFLIPAVFGPAAAEWVHGQTGHYELAFRLGIPLAFVSAVSIWRLKAHPREPIVPIVDAVGSTAA
jgi:MFS family permease